MPFLNANSKSQGQQESIFSDSSFHYSSFPNVPHTLLAVYRACPLGRIFGNHSPRCRTSELICVYPEAVAHKRKKKSPPPRPSGASIVRKFLALPRAGQEIMLTGLQHELTYGDRDSALELVWYLKNDERCREIISTFKDDPGEMTAEEKEDLFAKLAAARVLKLPKSKAPRRF